jgi:hypothetical protein
VTIYVIDWRCGMDMSKVSVCHNGHTICVAPSAIQAHLNHGDYLGNCTIPKEPIVATPSQDGIVLHQNYPNPFNPTTSIAFFVPDAGRTNGVLTLKIFDIRGRLIRVLWNDIAQPGYHTVVWDGRETDGGAAPSGIYICRMEIAGMVQQIRMVLVK